MNRILKRSLALILAVCTSATMAVSSAAADEPDKTGGMVAMVKGADGISDYSNRIGDTLTAVVEDKDGNLVDSGRIIYQWKRQIYANNKLEIGDIDGAEAKKASYKIQPADVGYSISFDATVDSGAGNYVCHPGSPGGYTTTGVVPDTYTITLTGGTKVGDVLSFEALNSKGGSLDKSALVNKTELDDNYPIYSKGCYYVMWKRANSKNSLGSDIVEKGDTYTTVAADAGKYIYVEIGSGNFGQYKNESNRIGLIQSEGGVVDKTRLRTAIDAASAAYNNMEESPDGKNVDPADKWVTKAVKDAFTSAKDTANTVLQRAKTTEEANKAAEVLEAATAAFLKAGKPGTKAAVFTITFDAQNGTPPSTAKANEYGNLGVGDFTTPIRAGFTFNGWFTAITGGEKVTAVKKFTANTTLYAQWTQNTPTTPPTTTTGGGSSGGSSTPAPAAPSKTIDNPVGNKGAASALDNAVKNAASSGAKNPTANITFDNYADLTPDGIKAINAQIAAAAKKAAAPVAAKLQFDSKNGAAVQSRIEVDPAQLAAAMSTKLPLNVWFNQVKDAPVTRVSSLFEKHYDNTVVAITFEQKSPLAVNMEFAAKLDLGELNTQTLYFYSYNPVTNIYIPIAAPQYRLDKNGYSHITAPLGGSILITDKPLTKK